MSQLGDAYSDRPQIDSIAAVFVGLIVGILTCRLAIADPLLNKSLSGFFAIGATVSALVTGMGSVAVSVLLGLDGRASNQLRKTHGRDLNRNWRVVMIDGLSSAAILVFAQLLGSLHPHAAWICASVAILLAAFTAGRMIWLISSLLGLAQADRNLKELPDPKIRNEFLKHSA